MSSISRRRLVLLVFLPLALAYYLPASQLLPAAQEFLTRLYYPTSPLSMPTYTNIVVAGAGGVGSRVVAEGVKEGLNITVFSRSASTTVPSGAKLVVVDYTSDSSLEQALKEAKAEVVVSGIQISPPNVPAQEALARAAKKVATVKLFVPSEYGNPTYGEKDKNSKIYAKTAFHHFLEDLKLPYLLVFTGPFADTVWNPFLGFDFVNGKVKLVGKGETPISFTARDDVARFLVHALSHFPAADLNNGILRIEGDRKTFKEAIALWEKSHPDKPKIETSHESVEDAQKFIDQDKTGAGVVKYLLLSWEKGASVEDEQGKTNNAQWPEWNPVSVESVLTKL